MPSRVSLLKSEAVGVIPPASGMQSGEVAVNYADKKIYGKHPGSGAVVQVAASPIHTHSLADLTASGATIDRPLAVIAKAVQRNPNAVLFDWRKFFDDEFPPFSPYSHSCASLHLGRNNF